MSTWVSTWPRSRISGLTTSTRSSTRSDAIPDCLDGAASIYDSPVPGALNFDDLVARFKVRVFRLAGRFFPRPEDAEDVTQEVFLKVFRSLPTYRGDAPLEHWILRIATTTCQDELRRRRRRPEARAARAPSFEDLMEKALAGKALDAAEAAAARSLAEDLLNRLPGRDRVVLTLL